MTASSQHNNDCKLQVIELAMKILTIRLDDQTHEDAKAKIARSPHSFQTLVNGWIEEYVGESKPAPPKTVDNKLDRWHELLAEILASGDQEIIDTLQRNLRVFHRVKNPQIDPKVVRATNTDIQEAVEEVTRGTKDKRAGRR